MDGNGWIEAEPEPEPELPLPHRPHLNSNPKSDQLEAARTSAQDIVCHEEVRRGSI